MGPCIGFQLVIKKARAYRELLAGGRDQHPFHMRYSKGKLNLCLQFQAHRQGNEKEPWFPRPLIQELDMQMPLLNLDNQQGKLEER